MKKQRLGLVLLFIIGLSILLYPTISNKWNAYRAGRLMSDYDKVVEKNTEEDLKSLLQAAQEYNQSLVGSAVPDAFSIRDGVEDPEYEKLLNVGGDGMMGYVEIPCIKTSVPIYHYTTDEVLQKGAGHLFGSSLPIGGDGTHAIISAHRGLPSAKLFTDLDRVKVGNQFYIHVLDDVLAYEVDQILVVKPDETSSLGLEAGKDYVTLITCTPYAVNSHRLLVRGHRVPYVESQHKSNEKEVAFPRPVSMLIRLGCVALGMIIATVIVLILTRKKKKKEAIISDATEESEIKEEVTETTESTDSAGTTGSADQEKEKL